MCAREARVGKDVEDVDQVKVVGRIREQARRDRPGRNFKEMRQRRSDRPSHTHVIALPNIATSFVAFLLS